MPELPACRARRTRRSGAHPTPTPNFWALSQLPNVRTDGRCQDPLPVAVAARLFRRRSRDRRSDEAVRRAVPPRMAMAARTPADASPALTLRALCWFLRSTRVDRLGSRHSPSWCRRRLISTAIATSAPTNPARIAHTSDIAGQTIPAGSIAVLGLDGSTGRTPPFREHSKSGHAAVFIPPILTAMPAAASAGPGCLPAR